MIAQTIPTPICIDPAAVYTVASVVLALDVRSETIRRAIRRGELPSVRRGNRAYIAGRDLLDWLTKPTERPTDLAEAKGAKRG